MDLLLSQDQIEIVDTLKDFLSKEAPVSRLRPPAKQIGNSDHRYWPRLAELGFLGIAIGESDGGIGLGAAEEMLAFREFGRHLLSPGILAIGLAARMAAAAGSSLVSQLLAGGSRVAVANARGSVTLGKECRGEFHIFDGEDADWIIACDESGAALFEPNALMQVEPVLGTDNVVSLQRARVERATAALWLPASAESIANRARLLLSAYAVGIAEATRDMAVDYAKIREQFGKPIGSFQAIKHICADMAIRSEAALCQVTFAALVLAENHDGFEFHSVASKLVASDAALKNAAQNIQVHGAIGFTAEADAHMFLKRAHLIDQLWGDSRHQRARMLAAEFAG
jgi:alkylation response protein AidB-like acyl-CoA dehydrogenase